MCVGGVLEVRMTAVVQKVVLQLVVVLGLCYGEGTISGPKERGGGLKSTGGWGVNRRGECLIEGGRERGSGWLRCTSGCERGSGWL